MLTIHCPRCDTALALDPASITASQGWARCGHCQHVFDAGQLGLPTLDPQDRSPTRDSSSANATQKTGERFEAGIRFRRPAPTQEPPVHFDWSHIDLGLPVAAAPEASTLPTPIDTTRDEGAVATSDTHQPATLQANVEPEWLDDTATSKTAIHADEPSWLRDDAKHPSDATSSAAEGVAQVDPLFAATLTNAAASSGDELPHTTPSPVAEQRIGLDERPPRRPWFRLFLGVAMVLTLVAQVVYMQRDWMVARWPTLEPPLRQLCEHMGCELRPLRDVRFLQVTHSAVVRLPNNHFQLDLEVRNDGLTRVATPQLELSLQNAQGHTWARRLMDLHIDGQPSNLAAQQRYSAQISWRTDGADADRLEAYQVRLVYAKPSEYTPLKQP